MKKTPFLAGALLALAPMTALLPGCGGGGGGIVSPTATATAIPSGTLEATPTSLPTGTPLPTNTPKPTSTVVPVGAVKQNLTFTPSSDSNFKNTPFLLANLNLETANGANTLRFTYNAPFNYDRVTLSGGLGQIKQGKTYTASSTDSDNIQIENIVLVNGNSRFGTYALQSGTLTVTNFTTSNATISFNKAVFSPAIRSEGTGTVTVNGTLSGPYNIN